MVTFTAKVMDSQLSKQLTQKQVAAKRAMAATMRELKQRAPAKVAAAVTKRYAIKAADVKPQSSGGRMAGGAHISARGETIEEFALTYTGGLMTPLHFKMSPTAPNGGRRYTIKATILKGQRKTIGHWSTPYSEKGQYKRPGASPFFLAAGNGGVVLPFQREGSKLAKVFKTVSIPQMVGNEEVSAEAIKEINTLAETRLAHHMKRFLGSK